MENLSNTNNTNALPDASTPVTVTKDLAEIAFKNAETHEKIQSIELDKQKTENETTRVTIDKVNTLRHLIESYIIDDERQIPGCEIVWKNTFDDLEVLRLKEKLFELINKF